MTELPGGGGGGGGAGVTWIPDSLKGLKTVAVLWLYLAHKREGSHGWGSGYRAGKII